MKTLIREVYQSHKEDKMPLKDMAVLYRTNTGGQTFGGKADGVQHSFPDERQCGPIYLTTGSPRIFFAYIKAALGQASRSDYLRNHQSAKAVYLPADAYRNQSIFWKH